MTDMGGNWSRNSKNRLKASKKQKKNVLKMHKIDLGWRKKVENWV